MTDALQTIALACGFLPAVVLLWFRVHFMAREIEELQRQAMTAMLADEIRSGRKFQTREGWHDYDAVN